MVHPFTGWHGQDPAVHDSGEAACSRHDEDVGEQEPPTREDPSAAAHEVQSDLQATNAPAQSPMELDPSPPAPSPEPAAADLQQPEEVNAVEAGEDPPRACTGQGEGLDHAAGSSVGAGAVEADRSLAEQLQNEWNHQCAPRTRNAGRRITSQTATSKPAKRKQEAAQPQGAKLSQTGRKRRRMDSKAPEGEHDFVISLPEVEKIRLGIPPSVHRILRREDLDAGKRLPPGGLDDSFAVLDGDDILVIKISGAFTDDELREMTRNALVILEKADRQARLSDKRKELHEAGLIVYTGNKDAPCTRGEVVRSASEQHEKDVLSASNRGSSLGWRVARRVMPTQTGDQLELVLRLDAKWCCIGDHDEVPMNLMCTSLDFSIDGHHDDQEYAGVFIFLVTEGPLPEGGEFFINGPQDGEDASPYRWGLSFVPEHGDIVWLCGQEIEHGTTPVTVTDESGHRIGILLVLKKSVATRAANNAEKVRRALARRARAASEKAGILKKTKE